MVREHLHNISQRMAGLSRREADRLLCSRHQTAAFWQPRVQALLLTRTKGIAKSPTGLGCRADTYLPRQAAAVREGLQGPNEKSFFLFSLFLSSLSRRPVT